MPPKPHPSRAGTAPSLLLGIAVTGIAALGIAPLPLGVALAQEIALSVNGDPITSVDLEQRMKLLRAIHKPATRDAAIESMISDRLKTREAQHLGINISDDELSEGASIVARRLKTTPQQLVADISKAGVSQTHARNFLRAEMGYSILIRALNRGVEASEIAVRQEIAKEKSKGGILKYTIRQVVFTMSPGENQAALATTVKQAEGLRTKFTSCDTGIPYAKSLPGVAVRSALTRSSNQIPDGLKEVLEKTPVGHLTGPSRSPNGIELIAVCDRSTEANDDDLRKTVSERILADHYEQEIAAKYKEMRSHAVIERR